MFAKGRYIGWLLGALCLVGQGCSSSAVQEAEHVVAQADSLRAQGMMYGIDEGDSITLAQAYETLGSFSLCNFHFSPSYARACYHYGRLLREKDDPVAAMQVFINATHSRTRDYHILGRVYSNMGDIAHLAGEYDLSYDMYERSGEMYLLAQDTLLYYYDLNNMAYELAYQADSSSCLLLLKQFEHIPEYMASSTMTKAELYLKCHEYDSAIYYAHQLCLLDENNVIGLLIKAQSFSFLHIQDSAAYYAKAVLDQPSYSLSDKQNALYILTNDDTAKNIEEVRKAAADRSDVQRVLKIRQGKMSQAVQLLEQDLHRKPDYRWLYAIIATLVIVGSGISIYVFNKRRKHRLLSQKVDELQQAASSIQEKHDDLSTRYTTYHQQVENEIQNICRMLRERGNISTELSWNNYDAMCQIIDRQFYMLASKLRDKNVLNETELRLCVLVLLDMSRAEIAHTLPYALNSIGKLKDHTAKSLGTTGKNLHDFLLKLAIEG